MWSCPQDVQNGLLLKIYQNHLRSPSQNYDKIEYYYQKGCIFEHRGKKVITLLQINGLNGIVKLYGFVQEAEYEHAIYQ